MPGTVILLGHGRFRKPFTDEGLGGMNPHPKTAMCSGRID